MQDTVSCLDCPACQKGFYISKDCNGLNSSDRECSPCKICSSGFYRNGCNSGTTFVDDVQCLQCSNCSLGMCFSFPSFFQISKTTNLTAMCEPGNFIEAGCNGAGFSAEDRTCAECKSSCKAGQFISRPCSGTSLRYSDMQCSNCTSFCPVDHYMLKGCSGMEYYVDRPTSCARCIYNCPQNHYLSSPCNGMGIDPFLSYTCKECTCPDGLHPEKECTNMLLNHECRNCKGAACMPSSVVGTTSGIIPIPSSSPLANKKTSILITTPKPAESTAEEIPVWILAVISTASVICVPVTVFCLCCRGMGRRGSRLRRGSY